MTNKLLMEVAEGDVPQLDNVIYIDNWNNARNRLLTDGAPRMGTGNLAASSIGGGCVDLRCLDLGSDAKQGLLSRHFTGLFPSQNTQLAEVVDVVGSRGEVMESEETRRAIFGAENAEYVDQAREHVEVAAHMLSQMGPDYARLAWVLTDALAFLDEV